MTNNFLKTFSIILIVAIVTALTRAIPYLIFGRKNKIPDILNYLGKILPGSIMVILVMYCLRSINFKSFPFGFPELISVLIIVILQIFKKNTFLSVFIGTACYMIMIRIIS